MNLIDFVLHIDVYLGQIIDSIGTATYIILFLIIFGETGLVVAPFLPGDSLVIAATALAGIGKLNIITLYIGFLIAAFLGDTLNYEIGKKIGSKIEKTILVLPAYNFKRFPLRSKVIVDSGVIRKNDIVDYEKIFI